MVLCSLVAKSNALAVPILGPACLACRRIFPRSPSPTPRGSAAVPSEPRLRVCHLLLLWKIHSLGPFQESLPCAETCWCWWASAAGCRITKAETRSDRSRIAPGNLGRLLLARLRQGEHQGRPQGTPVGHSGQSDPRAVWREQEGGSPLELECGSNAPADRCDVDRGSRGGQGQDLSSTRARWRGGRRLSRRPAQQALVILPASQRPLRPSAELP